MKINPTNVRELLKAFDFKTLFREELGWDNYKSQLGITVDGTVYRLNAIAEKRGFVAYCCSDVPDRVTRLKIDRQVTKSSREHLVVYCDEPGKKQVWHWVRRQAGSPLASRDHRFDSSQTGEALIQRLEALAFSLEEEAKLTIVDVAERVRTALDVDKVTKRFYDCFKKEHDGFQKLIKGITAGPDLQWYTSLMLNRLMFVYFIQKKGFLDGDVDYLRNRLKRMQAEQGKNRFHSFYRYFLLRLFHDGLGKAPGDRVPELEKLLGNVPYLNGGFFEVHPLESSYEDIDIADKAFERLFDFFDGYQWHLDERPMRADNEINPDVVGYIFEKYINQKQMGAYYTKEDITEYISKNTIVPFLFDAAEKKCAIAFKPDGAIWRLLQDDPDRYIHDAVLKGVDLQLPKEITAGIKDVSKRGKWNQPADPNFALPTETWREHIARRQRCLQIRKKLSKGEVHNINDLITLNLNIRQFAQDAIENCEGPELLRAFHRAIEGISVLDPTCGSGAFLFAALNILDPLYEACLDRMQAFLEDLQRSGAKHHPEKYSDFRQMLCQIDQHPSRRYFVLKSIIINNLYGVDIMAEAVEICKLRLFLRLVAQIDRVEDIEPLPDIDFNIRTGNTLVGFTSIDEVRQAAERESSGQGKLVFGEAAEHIKRIEEDAELADKAFQMFRQMQTTHGMDGKQFAEAKLTLRRRLDTLDDELDRYLAGEYGIATDDPKKTAAFDKWRTSHQPFHWFVEFYGIVTNGGFNVIIGNPPYVEYSAVRRSYRIRDYHTEPCGNLYAFVWERCLTLAHSTGRTGMIIPVASVCTDGYAPLQVLLRREGTCVVSNFNDRPSKLFDGLEHIRLSIILHQRTLEQPRTFSTGYNKWQAVERPYLFDNLSFAETTHLNLTGAMAKVGMPVEVTILDRIAKKPGVLADHLSRHGKHAIYYTRKLSHFVQILDFVPTIKDEAGTLRQPSELKSLEFSSAKERDVFLAALNSTMFYWLLTVYSDCRNLNKREVLMAPYQWQNVEPQSVKCLSVLSRRLMEDIRRTSKILESTDI